MQREGSPELGRLGGGRLGAGGSASCGRAGFGAAGLPGQPSRRPPERPRIAPRRGHVFDSGDNHGARTARRDGSPPRVCEGVDADYARGRRHGGRAQPSAPRGRRCPIRRRALELPQRHESLAGEPPAPLRGDSVDSTRRCTSSWPGSAEGARRIGRVPAPRVVTRRHRRNPAGLCAGAADGRRGRRRAPPRSQAPVA
jgi:hypothetical protein